MSVKMSIEFISLLVMISVNSILTAPTISPLVSSRNNNSSQILFEELVGFLNDYTANNASLPLKKVRSEASPITDFDWSRNGHDIPVFISELHNQPGFNRFSSLLDRAIVRAPWNVLTAKMFKLIAVFFLESYLVQLFGVSLPL
jgi:hypothetical protein